MSRNIVFEGWLTKSPPSRRIFKIKWRRRWFALRQSGELPGQYFLDYYSDRNRRRLKGSINLDLCEQVDAGLHMTRNSTGILDPRIRGSVFSIQTQSRTYHLEADCEEDMEKWVDAICRVCGLRATSSPPEPVVTIITASEELREIVVPGSGTYQNSTMTVMNDQYEFSEGTGPYIPISECITGVRAADSQSSFTFDPNNIVIGAKSTFEGPDKGPQYLSHPHIRISNVDLSENESNISDEECKSLNASHSNIARYGNIPDTWLLARSYVRPGPDDENKPNLRASGSGVSNRLRVRFSSFNKEEKPKPHSSPRRIRDSEEGPPVPPRPPKSVGFNTEHKESFQGPKIQEPEGDTSPPFPWLRSSRRMSHEQQAVNRPRVEDNACCLTHVRHNVNTVH
ncbi:GRB2-associated-binding protein 1 isoform X1 [Pieris rapae]|uniref:GRB2-associated-binding protein 1 isoform X1 n=2 Tax=Pieris rapae TaxID=64459 RepID=UPI001E27E348|nr:GRB2-associated-binding protein 1 isoform X1 [Pieris rapae]